MKKYQPTYLNNFQIFVALSLNIIRKGLRKYERDYHQSF